MPLPAIPPQRQPLLPRERTGNQAKALSQNTSLKKPRWITAGSKNNRDKRIQETFKSQGLIKRFHPPSTSLSFRVSKTEKEQTVRVVKPIKSTDRLYRKKGTAIFYTYARVTPPSKPLPPLPRQDRGLPPPPQERRERNVFSKREPKVPHPPPGPAPLANRPKTLSPSLQSPSASEQKQLPMPQIGNAEELERFVQSQLHDLKHPELTKVLQGKYLKAKRNPEEKMESFLDNLHRVVSANRQDIDELDRITEKSLAQVQTKLQNIGQNIPELKQELWRDYQKTKTAMWNDFIKGKRNPEEKMESFMQRFLPNLERIHSRSDLSKSEKKFRQRISPLFQEGLRNNTVVIIDQSLQNAKRIKQDRAILLAKGWEAWKHLDILRTHVEDSDLKSKLEKDCETRLNFLQKASNWHKNRIGGNELNKALRKKLNQVEKSADAHEAKMELKKMLSEASHKDLVNAISNEIVNSILDPKALLEAKDHKIWNLLKELCPEEARKLLHDETIQKLFVMRSQQGNINYRIPLSNDQLPLPPQIPASSLQNISVKDSERLEKVLNEIASTENTYFEGIKAAAEAVHSDRIFKRLPPDEREFLASHWDALKENTEKFCTTLNPLLQDKNTTPTSEKMACLIKQFSSEGFARCAKGITTLIIKHSLCQKILEKHPKFSEDIQKQGGDINSWFILPIQRIPRYLLLLNEVKKHANLDEESNKALDNVIKFVSDFACQANEAERNFTEKHAPAFEEMFSIKTT